MMAFVEYARANGGLEALTEVILGGSFYGVVSYREKVKERDDPGVKGKGEGCASV